MANYGHTRITATGPQPDRAALLAHVQATARDGLDFTLSGLFAPDIASDDLVRWAGLTATQDTVVLSVGIKWDLDALGLARLLATRFPALRIVGVFVAETANGIRVAMTGAGNGVVRVPEFEQALATSFAPEAVAHLRLAPDDFASDMHAEAAYRAHLASVMAARAVADALA